MLAPTITLLTKQDPVRRVAGQYANTVDGFTVPLPRLWMSLSLRVYG